MRSSARIFVLLLEKLRIPKLFILFFFALSFLSLPSTANAYGAYGIPNTEADVPMNQHTYMQTIFIEAISSIYCVVAGIDPIDPNGSCLGINPTTNKIGYEPTSPDGKVGGLIGQTASLISSMYTPATSTHLYFKNLADNFGLVKKTHAQANNQTFQDGTGFAQLRPILELWTIFRNFSYAILILAFIFIGIGVMLRVKIDPRTVMTIQNQIPKIVMAILLITFSYAIAAVMIDLMWVSTYVGINSIAIPNATSTNVAQDATANILNSPLSFFNQVFKPDPEGNGLFHVTDYVAKSIAYIVNDMVRALLHVDPNEDCYNFPVDINPGACVANVFGFLVRVVMWLIIFIVILIVLFKVWFELLKAYTFLLLYIITGPIFIVASLLPGSPLGFGKWIRNIFVNLVVFPLIAMLFVGARVFMDLFNVNTDPANTFIPPMIGNPHMENFGTLIAFGILLMSPQLLSMLREAMKVPGTKYGAAIGQTMSQGTGIAGAPAQRAWAGLTRRNPQTLEPYGVLARRGDNTKAWLYDKTFARLPGFLGDMGRSASQRIRNRATGQGPLTNQQVASHLDSRGQQASESQINDQMKNIKDKDWRAIPIDKMSGSQKRDFERTRNKLKTPDEVLAYETAKKRFEMGPEPGLVIEQRQALKDKSWKNKREEDMTPEEKKDYANYTSNLSEQQKQALGRTMDNYREGRYETGGTTPEGQQPIARQETQIPGQEGQREEGGQGAGQSVGQLNVGTLNVEHIQGLTGLGEEHKGLAGTIMSRLLENRERGGTEMSEIRSILREGLPEESDEEIDNKVRVINNEYKEYIVQGGEGQGQEEGEENSQA